MNNANPYDEILPNLYLGSIKALDVYQNESNSISFYMVVDLIKHTILLDKSETIANTKIYINLPVHDSSDECDNLLSLICDTQVLEKMHDCIINNKPVLVHCFAGMQRSCALVACYLIKYHHIKPNEAIDFIKSKRPIAFFGQVNFMETLHTIRMNSINEKTIYALDYMKLNRYNQRHHKTMFKNKINCKKFYELLESYNIDNNNESVKQDLYLYLYLYFDRKEYDFLSKLDKESLEYKKFIDLLLNNESLCIKIGNDKLKHEYKVSETLQQLNIPVFINHLCILECKDNLCIDNTHKFLDIKRNIQCNYDEREAKLFPDEIDVPVNILVMPYIIYGEIGMHVWSFDTFYILKNCMKHMVMALLYASYKLDFIHGYLYGESCHDSNLLLGKTDLKSISYGEFGELEIIDGFIPVINDYHTGGFIDYTMIDKSIPSHNHDYIVYMGIHRIINSITMASECKIPMMNNCECLQKINELYEFKDSRIVRVTPITKEICDMICSEIDKINYD
jgi:hypothetical protein